MTITVFLPVSARIPAYALYTDPPLTRVGRAVEKAETQGFMKVVADAGTRKILGAAIPGTGGDKAIHGVIDIMMRTFRWPCQSIRQSQSCSPTLLVDLKPAGS